MVDLNKSFVVKIYAIKYGVNYFRAATLITVVSGLERNFKSREKDSPRYRTH